MHLILQFTCAQVSRCSLPIRKVFQKEVSKSPAIIPQDCPEVFLDYEVLECLILHNNNKLLHLFLAPSNNYHVSRRDEVTYINFSNLPNLARAFLAK